MASRRLSIVLAHLVCFALAGQVAFADIVPQLTSAVSRRLHGGATPYDIALPLTGGTGIECRRLFGGAVTLVLSFDQPIVSGDFAVTAGTGSPNGAAVCANNQMTVNLSGATDRQTLTVTVSNVLSSAGGTLPSAEVTLRLIEGDVNASGSVNISDINICKFNSGVAVSGFNFRSDINANNGVNVSDINLVKSKSGLTGVGGASQNTAPTIGEITNQISDTGALTVEIAVADGESAAGTLAIKARADNAALIPNANVSYGGSNATRTVTMTAAANQTGAATITVSVGDGLMTTTKTFTLTVLATPKLFLAQMTPQGSAVSTASGVSTLRLDGDEMGATLRVSYTNLSSPRNAMHVHGPAGPTETGPVMFDYDATPTQPDGSWRWIFPSDPATRQPIIDAIKSGNTYINVHTSNYPSGEIRAQYVLVTGSQNFVKPPAPPPLPGGTPTPEDAARFLTQATFGPSIEEIANVQSLGLDSWLSQQFAQPTTSMYNAIYQRCTTSSAGGDALDTPRVVETWWRNARSAPDQLRQRVAFAYSEIFVVSTVEDPIAGQPAGLATYHDTLANDAFGNFRTLLKDVTLHPIMGQYLNMRGNVKPVSPNFTAPNENYAREVLQLFSVGLNKLQPDGTLKLDVNGLPIPTYDQSVVQSFAHVFTGWDVDTTPVVIPTLTTTGVVNVNSSYNKPMTVRSGNHSTIAKVLLDGFIIGQTTSQTTATANAELDAAIDNIFNHPNVGPFFCRELIQRLVGSNPSPAYLYRVVRAFEGYRAYDEATPSAARGDMKEVIKAILTDYEARSTTFINNLGYGHLREPLVRTTNVIRAFHPNSTSGYFKSSNTDVELFQTPYGATTVFNFFEPNYIQPGDIAFAGLFAPEFQIVSETSNINLNNYLYNGIQDVSGGWKSGDVKLVLTTEQNMALDPNGLLDRLNLLLMSGQMPSEVKTNIVNFISTMNNGSTDANKLNRAKAAIYLVATSSQCAVER